MTFRTQQAQGQASTIAYRYDPAGRLIASQHGDHAHRYPMDAAGNRLDGTASVKADNRLTQLDGSRYRHDGAGNLIEREAPNGERLTLGYDGANRLVTLTHTSAYGHTREAHYRYDALGRRIGKTVRQANGTTATHHYGWDGDRLVHEATENRQTTVVYEPGTFVPMLRIDQAGDGATKRIGAYITDALGTPLRLVTPQGETLWQAQPHDWAAVTDEQGSTAQPIRFQGQWHDEESGLYYNRHRYYDPQQGRYISQDPIGLAGGDNLYQYAAAPNIEVDPLGLRGVYGLGGGPYSQSNMVRRAAARQETSSKSIAAGADAGGEVFGGVFGTSLSSGGQVDSNGNFCLVTTACTKFGLGVYAGAGVDFGGAVNNSPIETGVTESWGIFARGGTGPAAGASINFGEGSTGGAKGFVGPGAGGALGVQFCKISTVCAGD